MINLEFQRRARELSQTALGGKILYSGSVISRLESGEWTLERVHPRLRRALEEFFNTSIETLLAPVDTTAGGQTGGER